MIVIRQEVVAEIAVLFLIGGDDRYKTRSCCWDSRSYDAL